MTHLLFSCFFFPCFRYYNNACNTSATAGGAGGESKEGHSARDGGAQDGDTSSINQPPPDVTDIGIYIVAPKDIVLAMKRDVEDHIKWALEMSDYDLALQHAESAVPPLSAERVLTLAER